ncbi:hypothetical protein BRADI_3g56183v3 [Brachypodium distachyon]|uniref:Uncharacterized protein n=1 Tax=Brachypodium distachyon TaxID=15368 RepID=A0A2K2D5D7_BRADI|nr:hypothetical protein BRADI_3g56183v3 [Brachypodium distachyon]
MVILGGARNAPDARGVHPSAARSRRIPCQLPDTMAWTNHQLAIGHLPLPLDRVIFIS